MMRTKTGCLAVKGAAVEVRARRVWVRDDMRELVR
jgi:hypothetical protein